MLAWDQPKCGISRDALRSRRHGPPTPCGAATEYEVGTLALMGALLHLVQKEWECMGAYFIVRNVAVHPSRSTWKSSYCLAVAPMALLTLIKPYIRYKAKFHYAIQLANQLASWSATCYWRDVRPDVQTQFDTFYNVALQLLDYFYPHHIITVTNRDPYYITPKIKSLLRRKNKLMRERGIRVSTAHR